MIIKNIKFILLFIIFLSINSSVNAYRFNLGDQDPAPVTIEIEEPKDTTQNEPTYLYQSQQYKEQTKDFQNDAPDLPHQLEESQPKEKNQNDPAKPTLSANPPTTHCSDQNMRMPYEHAYKASRVAGAGSFRSAQTLYNERDITNTFITPEEAQASEPAQASRLAAEQIQTILEDVRHSHILEAEHALRNFSFHPSTPDRIKKQFQPILDQLKLVLYEPSGALRPFNQLDIQKITYVIEQFIKATNEGMIFYGHVFFYTIPQDSDLFKINPEIKKTVYIFSDYFSSKRITELNKAIAHNPINLANTELRELVLQKKFDAALEVGEKSGLFERYPQYRENIQAIQKLHTPASDSQPQIIDMPQQMPAAIESPSLPPANNEQSTENCQQLVDTYQKQSSNDLIPTALKTVWQERMDVMKEMVALGQHYSKKTYQIEHNTAAMLESHGIDANKFKSFYGNQIQQHLHEELIVFLDYVAQMKQQDCDYQAYRLIEIAQAWKFFNQRGKLGLTTASADYGWAVVDSYRQYGNQIFSPEYTQALNLAFHKLLSTIIFVSQSDNENFNQIFINGTVQAAENIAHSIAHLDQTVKNIGKALGSVAWFAIRVIGTPTPEDINYGLIENFDYSKKIEESIENDAYDFQMALFNKINSMTEKEIAQGAIATALEFMITDKAIQKVGAVAKQAPALVKNSDLIAISEHITESARNIARTLEETESLIVATEGSKVLSTTANATNVAKDIGKATVVTAEVTIVADGTISSGKLKPLGLGSTGRSEPLNLIEKLAMEEIMANPELGVKIDMKKGMTDPRWPKEQGWIKMAYNSNNTEIHYVAKVIDGNFVAVDDFKFKI